MASISAVTLGVAQAPLSPLWIGEGGFGSIVNIWAEDSSAVLSQWPPLNDFLTSRGYELYLTDLTTRTRVEVPTNPNSARDYFADDLSTTGAFAAYTYMDAQHPPTFKPQVEVFDTTTGVSSIASRSATGVLGNGDSYDATVSDDGRWAVFTSLSTNLVGDTSAWADIYRKDMQTGAVVMVSRTAAVQANAASADADISDNGRYVVFQSAATNLVSGDTNGSADIFLKDMTTGTVTLVSKSLAGVVGNGASSDATVSDDGRYVTFQSTASNLVASDTNDPDTFRKDMVTGAVTLIEETALRWTGRVFAVSGGVDIDVLTEPVTAWDNIDTWRIVFTDTVTGQQVKSDTFNSTSVYYDEFFETTDGTPPRVLSLSPDGRQAVVETYWRGDFDTVYETHYVFDLRALAEGLILDPALSAGRDMILNVGVPGGKTVLIDWGDGQQSESGVYGSTARLAHGYAADGVYAAVVTPDGQSVNAQTWTVRIDTDAGVSGAQAVNGGAGRDIVVGSTGRDTVNLGGSDDIARTGADADAIFGEGGNDVIYAGDDNDVLDGGAGDDVMNGGAGADQITGGLGNDRFIVDSTGDRVYESAGGGTDTVVSSISYRLLSTSEMEVFTASGTAAITLEGNGYGQTLVGNNGDNRLKGMVGNDTLRGGIGNDSLYGGNGVDTLTGGAGLDSFVFDFAPNRTTNVDSITDYSVADDRFLLDDAAFVGIGATGALGAARFKLGTAATDADDRIIYDAATGKVYFDANGNVAGGQIHFATVAIGTALTAGEFLVF